jgi:hypothetical protein
MEDAIHILILTIFKFCQLSKKQCMLEQLEMHVCSMALQDTNTIVAKRNVSLQDRIYQESSMVASAGRTNWDLAAPQFCRNWEAYNL